MDITFPRSFEYHAPSSLQEAVGLLSRNADAKVLAGGQSLIPMMKLRLATPEAIIDISKIKGLSGITVKGNSIKIGSMTKISDLGESPVVESHLSALHDASIIIADTQVRDMGTLGGNIANADPYNDMPVVALAFDASIGIYGKAGMRTEQSSSFFVDAYTTKASSTEIITDITFNVPGARYGSAYSRVDRRVGDYALSAASAMLELNEAGEIIELRIAASGLSNTAMRLPETESYLTGQKPSLSRFKNAAEKAISALNIEDSIYATGRIKKLAAEKAMADALSLAYTRAKAIN